MKTHKADTARLDSLRTGNKGGARRQRSASPNHLFDSFGCRTTPPSAGSGYMDDGKRERLLRPAIRGTAICNVNLPHT